MRSTPTATAWNMMPIGTFITVGIPPLAYSVLRHSRRTMDSAIKDGMSQRDLIQEHTYELMDQTLTMQGTAPR